LSCGSHTTVMVNAPGEWSPLVSGRDGVRCAGCVRLMRGSGLPVREGITRSGETAQWGRVVGTKPLLRCLRGGSRRLGWMCDHGPSNPLFFSFSVFLSFFLILNLNPNFIVNFVLRLNVQIKDACIRKYIYLCIFSLRCI
jgi:hypothetical protein